MPKGTCRGQEYLDSHCTVLNSWLEQRKAYAAPDIIPQECMQALSRCMGAYADPSISARPSPQCICARR